MLDLVPFAGSRGKVTDTKTKTCLVRKALQIDLPRSPAVAVAAARVRGDRQLARPWIGSLAHLEPPAPNGGNSERGSVVVNADAHPPVVGDKVIDAVRDDLAKFGVNEVMDIDVLGLSRGSPLPTGILEPAHQLLLLGVDRDHRLLAPLRQHHSLVDVLELCIAVRMLLAFERLAIGLQAVLLSLQCPGDTLAAD